MIFSSNEGVVFQLTDVQMRAIDPASSIWLTAHAGTGKTKVLVDRILRLLLQGEAPSSILAMTYTKAAAGEMQERLLEVLKGWSKLDDAQLEQALLAIGAKADLAVKARAKALFGELLDSPYPLQIQTIHSFCQSLLARFPLEAGLSSSTAPIEEPAQLALLNEAKQGVFAQMAASDDTALRAASELLATSMADRSVDEVLSAFIEQRLSFFVCLQSEAARQHYLQALCQALPGYEYTPEDWLARRCMDDGQVGALLEILREGGKEEKQAATKLAAWLKAPNINEYLSFFLTDKGAPRQRLMNSATGDTHPDLRAVALAERAWAQEAYEALQNRAIYQLSLACSHLAIALLSHYEALKDARGLLDYDDLIDYSNRLLSRPGMCEWVLSKLDLRLNHILLDEAQDTSPQLWMLLQRLVSELFVPELYTSSPRSLFVVGDRKQSIYRFQGADPQGFTEHARYYAQHFAQSGQAFALLTLDRSFRSSAAVLEVVDRLCALPQLQEAIAELDVAHRLHRRGAYGCVRLWPLVDTPPTPAPATPWQLLGEDVLMPQTAQHQLAQQIACDAALRIAKGERRAGDIMVLLRRRGEFAAILDAAFRAAGVPVAGADRLALKEQLPVQDILAMIRFCLLESDDLSLAQLLKGPLFNYDEAALFELAHPRAERESLWQRLQHHRPHDAALLVRITRLSRELRPYEFVCHLLEQIGPQPTEITCELKEQVLLFEQQHPPHLQLFLPWFEANGTSIKRDAQNAGDAVRIMTVHGAKGLQAPLVYLPDTTSLPQTGKERVLWHQSAASKLAIVAPKQGASAALSAIKRQRQQADYEEYVRLLYVALTRAESELVVAGIKGAKQVPAQSWYGLMEQVMQAFAQADDDGGYCHERGEKASPDKEEVVPQQPAPEPDWLNGSLAAALRQQEQAVICPSQLYEGRQAPAQLLPLQNAEQAKARGHLLHAALQLMPKEGLSDLQLDSALAWLAAREEMALSAEQKAACIADLQRIYTQHPVLFAASSQAEISLQGRIMFAGKPLYVRGQIDRLVETDAGWLVVDYKSNAQVPDVIPPAYLTQLAAYRAMLLAQPHAKPVQCAILWTENARLDVADADAMEQLCQPIAAVA